jgi:hypothetical protein
MLRVLRLVDLRGWRIRGSNGSRARSCFVTCTAQRAGGATA